VPIDTTSLSLGDLKDLLKARGMITSGKRKDMVSRLTTSLWRDELASYEEYENMTIGELKELLKHRSLTTFGKKKELIERLSGLSKKEILKGIGKEVSDSLPLALMPSVNFHLRDYGINANDPHKTLIGLTKLSKSSPPNFHRIKKLFQQLVVSVNTPFMDQSTDMKYIQQTPEKMILRIMAVVYTGNWYGFPRSQDMMDFLNLEIRPNFIMNWVSEDFTELMRRQGPTGPGVFTLFNQFE